MKFILIVATPKTCSVYKSTVACRVCFLRPAVLKATIFTRCLSFVCPYLNLGVSFQLTGFKSLNSYIVYFPQSLNPENLQQIYVFVSECFLDCFLLLFVLRRQVKDL